jgi:aryl-alcohol dehydrogenase-like predicted oxidoreductase
VTATRNISRLEENLGALNVQLTPSDFDTIEASLQKTTVGNRY